MKKILTTAVTAVLMFLSTTVSYVAAQDRGAPDTLYLLPSELEAGGNDSLFTLEAWIFNDSDGVQVQFGFGWDSDLIKLDSVRPSPISFSLFAQFFFYDGTIENSNLRNRAAFSSFSFVPAFFPPSPDRTLLATYYFSVENWTRESQIVIDSLAFDDGSEPFFSDEFGAQWEPVWYWGDEPLVVRDLNADACCGQYTGGFTGNTDCDPVGLRDLADIFKLIDHIYLSKKDLCCPENGNVNGSDDGKVNLCDIFRLVDHAYLSKTETAPCQ